MDLTTALFSILVVVATVAAYFIRQLKNYWKNRGIPHDEPSLIWGSLQGMATKYHQRDIFQRTYKKYKGTGPFCGFFFFQKPTVFITDINLVKNVLIKDFSNFADRNSYYNEKDDPLSAHMFALDYAKWKPLRHKLSPTFTSGKMKFMFPIVVKVGHEFADTFVEMLKEGSTVEVKDLFARFTTDVIATCAFGIDCHSLKDPDVEFRAAGRRFLQSMKDKIVKFGFGMAFPNLARKLGVTITPPDVSKFFINAVRDTMAYREKHQIKRNDFMDSLIELLNDTKSAKAKDDMQFSLEELAAQAFIFYFGGFETSSTTGTFALYELALHQDMQDKLREEINEVLAKHNQEFTYECMKDMQYMDQVISETLRLYTVVPALGRRCLADYQVPNAPGYVIEKGAMVLIPAQAIHHDPEFYPNPHVFDPENFQPERVKARESVTSLAFGDGPRNCIGMRFGQMQARIGLALLLQRFKFSRAKETVVPVKIDNTNPLCGSKGGVYLKVEKV